MKISLAQIDIESGNVTKNIQTMLSYVEKAKKDENDLVIFPEMSDTGYDMEVILKKATTWKVGVVPALCEAAKLHNINIIAGVSEKDKADVFNAVVVINREGEITGNYRKTHLITAEPMLEHKFLKPGNKLGIVKVDGHKIGIITCYEIRFPEISRALALSGIELLVIPAAWPLVRLPHWNTLIPARAIENQIYVAATSRIGNDTGLQFSGSSMIISPYGNTLASATQIHEGLISSVIDFNFINTVRSQIKVHQDRRADLYGSL